MCVFAGLSSALSAALRKLLTVSSVAAPVLFLLVPDIFFVLHGLVISVHTYDQVQDKYLRIFLIHCVCFLLPATSSDYCTVNIHQFVFLKKAHCVLIEV